MSFVSVPSFSSPGPTMRHVSYCSFSREEYTTDHRTKQMTTCRPHTGVYWKPSSASSAHACQPSDPSSDESSQRALAALTTRTPTKTGTTGSHRRGIWPEQELRRRSNILSASCRRAVILMWSNWWITRRTNAIITEGRMAGEFGGITIQKKKPGHSSILCFY